ncbi:HAD family hydrolase [Candidatus Woesearchaeota archaeon]|jgi:FMN phosphatase YigB (HAD superfamily)|nr:HAD family hydrolase [Candidatus Woesearchaeota archaeon]MBT4151299.1 HAD family hydrolase [Candidatus Woesearchaeota archaeon]MBT4247464.1 HAD family hydrolase [Candidatus Woesearchaeota archaeon]MBT4434121.1 HAD family hydrolase [Candidatus Woesearchaeota archaeon]MBT7332244.1 HAD family hydrolase [Candidatus Woesearchaeota archaeon]
MTKVIITDIYDFLLKGDAFTRRSLLTYLSGKTTLPEEQIVAVYAPHKERSYTDQGYNWNDAIRDTFAEIGHEDICDDFLAYNLARNRETTANDGITELLEKAKERNIPVFGVTDCCTPTEDVWDAFRSCGLDQYIAGIVSSKDVGYTKPSKEIFEHFLQTYGYSKEDVIFGAHDLDELQGANKLGIETFACYQDPNDDLSFLPEDHVLNDIKSLLDLL